MIWVGHQLSLQSTNKDALDESHTHKWTAKKNSSPTANQKEIWRKRNLGARTARVILHSTEHETDKYAIGLGRIPTISSAGLDILRKDFVSRGRRRRHARRPLPMWPSFSSRLPPLPRVPFNLSHDWFSMCVSNLVIRYRFNLIDFRIFLFCRGRRRFWFAVIQCVGKRWMILRSICHWVRNTGSSTAKSLAIFSVFSCLRERDDWFRCRCRWYVL